MTRSTGASAQFQAVAAVAVRVVLAGSLLVACSVTPVSSTPPAASATNPASATPTAIVTPAPTGATAIREGLASAGTYTTTAFEPTILLTLPSDGWRFFFTDDNDELALGQGDVEITGGRVANVIDPATRESVPAPGDLVSWLAAHPRLRAESARPVAVGGISGESIDVTNAGPVDVELFAYPTGNLRIAAGVKARLWVLPYDGPDLVFTGFARSDRFEQSLAPIEQVVDSIVIAPD